jgi:hypothetical protein
MNDNDELNERAVLSAVRDSVSGVPMGAAPHLDTITARARARRRRHVAGLSIAGGGAAAAAALGLALGSGAPVPAQQHPAPAAKLAAFTVVTDRSGATTLTLSQAQVIDPNAVRQALAAHGIPALVTAGRFCHTAILVPGAGVSKVVVLNAPRLRTVTPSTKSHPPRTSIVIHGTAMPRGAELSIGYRQDAQSREISFTLIKTGAPLTCTTTLPDSGPSHH